MYAGFRKYNVVKVVVSGPLEMVETWKSKDEDNRIIRGIDMYEPNEYGMNAERFEKLVRAGEIEVFGELVPFYRGSTLADPGWWPYLKICEKYDTPVLVHTGNGPPGTAYRPRRSKARLRFGDPFLIEDVLVRYPKLRICLAHFGGSFHERALAMMCQYPQVYSDLAAYLFIAPLPKRYAREFLHNAKQAGCLDRVMFGSDAWKSPDVIGESVDYLSSLDFLTEKDKRDILYNNAARFLRLKE
jgi:uncharacterized protein